MHRNDSGLNVAWKYKALEGLLIDTNKNKEAPQKQYFCDYFPEPQRAGVSQGMVLSTLQKLAKM